jgi:hypothetical protein
LAEVWTRLASQGLTDLHTELRTTGTGNPNPSSLGNPRLNMILGEVKLRFPPILSTSTIRGDDLLMIAGVLDRCDEIQRLVKQPIALSPGPTTTVTAVPAVAPATTGSLAITLASGIMAALERTRARAIVNLLIELVPTARISLAMRGSYGAFIEFSRDKHQ